MRRAGLDTLIFFVTSRCNSRCRTCFYWRELNQSDDLTDEEIDRFGATMPRFAELWLSGGEPTLRPGLAELVATFHRRNGVRRVNLPANGLDPERLAATIEAIGARCPDLRVNLNLALDGLEATHDRLRGVPGNFRRLAESLDRTLALRRAMPGLRVHVNTVLCAENLDEVVRLAELVRRRFDVDGHYFQIIRGEPLEPGLAEVARERVEETFRAVAPFYRHYAARLRRRKGGVAGRIAEAAYLGTLELYHSIQAANLDRHRPWPVRCTAGASIVVLDANGDLRACELRGRVTNVRAIDYDWRGFWESKRRAAELAAIERDGCWCTHVCFIHASVQASAKARAVDVPRAYLRSLRRAGGEVASAP